MFSIPHPHRQLPEPGRGGAVGHFGGLTGLTLAAVVHAPQSPMVAVADGVAAFPEFGRDPLIVGVL